MIAYITAKAKESGQKTDEGIEITPFSFENLAHITGITEEKVTSYIKKLEQANLVKIRDDSMIIKGVEDLNDYLRYIALKEKFEKM